MACSTALDDRLPGHVMDAIHTFQSYVVGEYRRRSSRWNIAQKLVQSVAQRLVDFAGCQGAVVEPVVFAGLLNVEVRYSGSPGAPMCGRIAPVERGFEAVVFGRPGEPRSRFTVAHECGHVLFYFGRGTRPQRIMPIGGSDTNSRVAAVEEGLCDDFARALLLPNQLLVELENRELRLCDLLPYADAREVSPQVVLRRILYDKGWCSSSVFYSVRRERGRVRVRVYRGLERRRATDSAPSAPTLEVLLSKEDSADLREAVAKVLELRNRKDENDVGRRGSTVWARV